MVKKEDTQTSVEKNQNILVISPFRSNGRFEGVVTKQLSYYFRADFLRLGNNSLTMIGCGDCAYSMVMV